MSSDLNEWHSWRRSVDTQLLNHTEAIATLRAYQQVMRDNEAARHSKTPQVIYWIIAGSLSALSILMQLWAMGGRVTP